MSDRNSRPFKVQLVKSSRSSSVDSYIMTSHEERMFGEVNISHIFVIL